MGKCRSIVTLAVISEHMPDGGETTAAALLAAISNFSGIFAASLIGARVVEALGIKEGNYGTLGGRPARARARPRPPVGGRS